MRYRINHTTKYAYTEPVPVCQNKLHLAPRNTRTQLCREYNLLVRPEPSEIDSQSDFFGNQVDYFSVHSVHRGLSVTSTSLIEVPDRAVPPTTADSIPWEEVARNLQAPATTADLEACLYVFPSEFIEPSPQLAAFAAETITAGKPIFTAAQELTARIHREFKYISGVTHVGTPLEQVLQQRAGVCQDFAHLEIACFRSLGLAARYVSGYLRTLPPPGKPRLVGADASHAWLSVYCGPTGWVDFDPTNNVIPSVDHITVAYGRDYADVCPIQGVFVGGGDHTMMVSVDVQPLVN